MIYKFKKTELLGLLLAVSTQLCAQTVDGPVSYAANAPEKIIFTGDYRPVITLGDSVSFTITGQVNLRPYEVEKKKGGFFGIGAKRYKERHDDIKPASQVKVALVLEGTNYETEGTVNPAFTLNETRLKSTEIVAAALRQEYTVSGYIHENGKNPYLGWSRIQVAMTFETRGRINYILKFIKEERPTSMARLQPVLELGNVLRQHPDELAKQVVAFYRNNFSTEFQRIKKDLFEFLLLKSPNSLTIQADLASAYIDDLQFAEALAMAKNTIARLEGRTDESLSQDDRSALATSYRNLADISSKEKLGTQKNAYNVAAYYYSLAAKYFYLAGNIDEYSTMTIRQVKCLQLISSVASLQEAAKILQKYLNETSSKTANNPTNN
jgi:hypothetical protein